MKERDYLESALNAVSQKFKWPPYEEWKRYHLNRLSEEIFKTTQTSLSLDTLRRLTGKKGINENYDPQPATKEALAVLLGFTHWEGFKETFQSGKADVVQAPVVQNLPKTRLSVYVFAMAGLGIFVLVALAVLAWWWMSTQKTESAYPFEKLLFIKDESPVPNTISVVYDKKAGVNDSLWVDFGNERFIAPEKATITNKSGQLNYCYRIPGYYQIKINSGNTKKAIDSSSVFVPGNGWHSYIYVRDLHFLPINNETEKGWLKLNKEKISKYFYPLDNLYSDFRYFKRWNMSTDSLTFSAIIRTEPLENMYSCQATGFRLVGETGEASFDFDRNGCMAFTGIKVSDFQLLGNNANLNYLEYDFSKETAVKVKIEDKKLRLYINGNLHFECSYTLPMGKLLGVVFVFQGVGSIGNVVVAPAQDSLKSFSVPF